MKRIALAISGLSFALLAGCAHNLQGAIPALPAAVPTQSNVPPALEIRAGAAAKPPTFLMPTPDYYDDGYTPSVAFVSPGKLVEEHVSGKGYLWYHVGVVDHATVSWAKSHQYDDGVTPAVAGNGSGGVFEVHRHSSSDNRLYYRTGKVQSDASVQWIGAGQYSNGNNPDIAFSRNDVILESHADDTGLGSWRVAGIASNGQITWGKTGTFTGGFQPSVAANANRTAVEVERDNKPLLGRLYSLYYRVGRVDAAGRSVTWLNRQEIRFAGTEEKGKSLSVALDDAGNVIVLYVCTRYQGTVFFDYGWCSLTGKLGSDNLIQWITPSGPLAPPENYFLQIHGLSSPSVALSNGVAVGVTQQGAQGIFFGTTFLTDRSNWMGDRLTTTLKGKTLRQIVMPASHDAGMYKGTGDFLGLTQSENFYDQLSGGQRYFDIRPDADLNVSHGPIIGPSVQTILNDVKKYMQEGHREVVILKFSHFGFDPATTASNPYQKLLSQVVATLRPWLYYKSVNSRLADIPLSTLIPADHGVVLPVMDLPDTFNGAGASGVFTYRDWETQAGVANDLQFTVFDGYTNTEILSKMQNDQLDKLRNFNGKMQNLNAPCDLFLLSWTLTPYLAIRSSAALADATLAPEMSHVRKNGYGFIPNLLYVDFYSWADAADVAIAANATFTF